MRLTLLIFALLLSACEVQAPAPSDCVEFDRNTLHKGKPVSCRMMFCNGHSNAYGNFSGIATLWCEETP